ncbi:MAG: hypothetical protein JSS44_09115 [Proteobacteria bacterium]|nr:hypothetical protein [Pseudomonadota bacterium]
MAYVSGTASTFAALLAGLQSACTANGWTLDGNVLHKGTCFVEAIVVPQDFPCLRVQAGTGVAGGALTGRSDIGGAQLGTSASNDTAYYSTIPIDVPFVFPLSYEVHIHSAPDEVYLVVNYAARFYQFVAFGQSAQPGLSGSGNWYAGTDIASNRAVSSASILADGGRMAAAALNGGLAMCRYDSSQGYSNNAACHHALDAGASAWQIEGAWRDWYDLNANTPSAFNSEAVLIPVRMYAYRPSGFVSVVAELAHARFVNIGSLDDQQIITLGTDRWKVYPWWARGAVYDAIGHNGNYSGLNGHALRYDGP